MTKDEMLRILILLSQIDGIIIGKLGSHTLPDYISEELSDISELLSQRIKE